MPQKCPKGGHHSVFSPSQKVLLKNEHEVF